MKKLALIAVLTAALTVAASAGARGDATGKAPTLRSLQAQITTLKRQVKTLQKRVNDTRDLAFGTLAFSGCSVAATADALQGTWTTLDTRFGTIFGAQTPLDDSGLCKAFSIVRSPNQPTASVFGALLNLFKASAASVQEGVAALSRPL
jgi:hypothetical protein